MRILVIGSCIVDFIARPTSTVETDSSNEGDITCGAGGAGRNVAENLSRLGCSVTMVTDMGDDFLGRFLMDNLATLGIELRRAHRGRTGLYLALLDRGGVLDQGFCHTDTEHIPAEDWVGAIPDLATFDGAVLDANLGQEALEALARLCREAGVPYGLETAASERSRRVIPAIPGCFLVKPDRGEARVLTGLPCETPEEVAACASALRSAGARNVIVSLGADGFVFQGEHWAGAFRPEPGEIIDVTGAGDALFSATFAGLLRGLPPREALGAGARAAAMTCAAKGAVCQDLSPALFTSRSHTHE